RGRERGGGRRDVRRVPEGRRPRAVGAASARARGREGGRGPAQRRDLRRTLRGGPGAVRDGRPAGRSASRARRRAAPAGRRVLPVGAVLQPAPAGSQCAVGRGVARRATALTSPAPQASMVSVWSSVRTRAYIFIEVSRL